MWYPKIYLRLHLGSKKHLWDAKTKVVENLMLIHLILIPLLNYDPMMRFLSSNFLFELISHCGLSPIPGMNFPWNWMYWKIDFLNKFPTDWN
jgi:hypothetical protein